MALRALEADLGALARGAALAPLTLPRGGPWSVLAEWGGSALGLACLNELAPRGERDALVISVGRGVHDGLPTAMRATIQGRAPLTGRFAEGHVGGDLGSRLASVCDALVLRGRAPRGAVLVLAADGARLHARPELSGTSPAEAARALEAEFGPCAVLTIGPAGEEGLAFASLASGSSPPSFVGRGGLGALFGALGLKALCVRAPLRPASEAPAGLLARLRASPRLAARASGGTMELFDAWEARGELAGGRALAEQARAQAAERHGCRGCPTPCGWSFERAEGGRQPARFGASHALGVTLGLTQLEDALALLAEADRLCLDAKEAGAVLALECVARERGLLSGTSPRGEREALARHMRAWVADPAHPARGGANRWARVLGLTAEVPVARGEALRPERNLAVVLGQCVASGGADPMRSFPFLLESCEPARLRELLAPLSVSDAALDPAAPIGKGRLVYWHENLISALDMTGFCAFSAAGLLADELCSLDELARWVLPRALEEGAFAHVAPGRRLLAVGANLVLARQEWNRRYGASAPAEWPRAVWERLSAPGMLDEYRALRGLDEREYPQPETLARFGAPELLGRAAPYHARNEARPAPESLAAPERAAVDVQFSGALATALGPRVRLELALPATLAAVLAELERTRAVPRGLLFRGERLVPAVWRAGGRVHAADTVRAGDVLELVTAIGGG